MMWFWRKPKIVYPFRPILDAMHEKDAALFQEVKGMAAPAAVRRWREVYPGDFA